MSECCGRCFDCLAPSERVTFMVVCPDCGNKRCPKSTHHDNACTGSNKPGQTGSRYA